MENNKNNLDKNFKNMPNMKLDELKMENIEELDELNNVDYSKVEYKKPDFKNGKHYPESHYKTVKEMFLNTLKKYPNRPFIYDKDNPKDPKFKEVTYKEFAEDVNRLGTALTKKLKVGGDKIVIIGENQYDWYVSYLTILNGAGIAVPVDKELPENEIENVVNRSRATVVIFSNKLKEKITNIKDKLKTVKYYIEMRKDYELKDSMIGFNTVLKEGEKLISKGDDSFSKIKIDPDEFKALFFTSGTTANSKGVMVNNRQLANNINACSAYVIIMETDKFFSILPLHHTYESTIGFLLAMANGASIAVCQGLRYISENLKETHPSIIMAVPLILENLYKNIKKNIKKSKKDKLVAAMIQKT